MAQLRAARPTGPQPVRASGQVRRTRRPKPAVRTPPQPSSFPPAAALQDQPKWHMRPPPRGAPSFVNRHWVRFL